jgi:SAM-dependent methyltransferase
MDTNATHARLQATMQDYAGWVRSSAAHLLPFVEVHGKRVVDFGCGRGDWLTVAVQQGATSVLGLDTYAIDGTIDAIPTRTADLTQPVVLGEVFDVALCLEVGEHLDARYADTLVQSLVDAAPVVLFSAAAPGQGGVHHVNEQPPAYWAAKFAAHGYRCFDVRAQTWTIDEIEPWYRMGFAIYAAPGAEPARLRPFEVSTLLHLVHPDIFAAYATTGRDVILHFDTVRRTWYPEFLPSAVAAAPLPDPAAPA